MESVVGLFPLILLGGLLLLLMSRGRAARRQQTELQAALAPGQEVMTTAGLYGRVSTVDDSVVELEIAPGVRCRYARAAIARIVPTPSPQETAPPAEGSPTERPAQD